MASQSFNLIGQEKEQELVAFETRQSRGPTPQSRSNSRMEMLSQLIKSQGAIVKSQAEANKSLEAKLSSTDDKLIVTDSLQTNWTNSRKVGLGGSDIYRGKIAPGQPLHWIGPNSEESHSSGACLDGQRALHASFDHPLVTCPGEVQNGQIVRSTTTDSCPSTQELTLKDETKFKFR